MSPEIPCHDEKTGGDDSCGRVSSGGRAVQKHFNIFEIWLSCFYAVRCFFYEFRSISMQFVSVDLAVGFLCSSETFVEKAFALEFVLFIDAH